LRQHRQSRDRAERGCGEGTTAGSGMSVMSFMVPAFASGGLLSDHGIL
jgi:hypothetical protein